MKRVPMPPADGAPFRCNLVVPRPKPMYWDTCNEIATEAWQPTVLPAVSSFLQLRCDLHTEDPEKKAPASLDPSRKS